MFFILGGCLNAPTFIQSPYVWMPPVHLNTPTGVHPHMFPLLLCASVCSQSLWHVVGGCKGPPYMWNTSLHLPLYGGATPSVPPPQNCWLPCESVGFRDIGM